MLRVRVPSPAFSTDKDLRVLVFLSRPDRFADILQFGLSIAVWARGARLPIRGFLVQLLRHLEVVFRGDRDVVPHPVAYDVLGNRIQLTRERVIWRFEPQSLIPNPESTIPWPRGLARSDNPLGQGNSLHTVLRGNRGGLLSVLDAP